MVDSGGYVCRVDGPDGAEPGMGYLRHRHDAAPPLMVLQVILPPDPSSLNNGHPRCLTKGCLADPPELGAARCQVQLLPDVLPHLGQRPNLLMGALPGESRLLLRTVRQHIYAPRGVRDRSGVSGAGWRRSGRSTTSSACPPAPPAALSSETQRSSVEQCLLHCAAHFAPRTRARPRLFALAQDANAASAADGAAPRYFLGYTPFARSSDIASLTSWSSTRAGASASLRKRRGGRREGSATSASESASSGQSLKVMSPVPIDASE